MEANPDPSTPSQSADAPPASPSPSPPPPSGSTLSPARALMIAWVVWLAMLVVPFVLTLITIVTVWWMDYANATLATAGAVVAGLWIAIGVPLAFLAREHVFREFWQGGTVEPHAYLRGMITIWAAMEIGGLISLIGCLIAGALMPGLLMGAVAFMLFFPFWPSGSAMTDRVGNTDDDEVFHHPR